MLTDILGYIPTVVSFINSWLGLDNPVIFVLLISLLYSIGDRIRGSGEIYFISTGLVGAAFFVACIGFLVSLSPHFVILLFLAYLWGESYGWGHPFTLYLTGDSQGQEYEGWQINKTLKTKPKVAIFVRGLIWSLPIAAVLWFISPPLAFLTLFVFPFSMLSSLVIAKNLFKKVDPTHEGGIAWQQWQRAEQIRGFLVMFSYSLFTVLYLW